MNFATVEASATAEASVQSVPLLITCLHASAVSTPPAEVRRAFDIIEKLLSNRVQHPTEQCYTSFSATSTAWVNRVLPLVYALRLAAWMGCTLTSEGTRYVFIDNRSEAHAPVESNAEDQRRRRDQQQQQQQLVDRLDELRCVASVWNMSVAEISVDASRRYLDAYGELLKLFQSAQDSIDREEVWTRHITCLQLYCLLARVRGVERQQVTTLSQATSDVLRGESAASWTARAQRELDRSLCSSSSVPLCNAQGSSMARTLPVLDARRTCRRGCETLATCLADDSLQWLLSRVSLCELRRMCERAVAESASGAAGGRESRSRTTDPLIPGFSVKVAERLRQQAQLDQHQRYIDTTGPAYRRLSQEERRRGESLILSIAALLQQIVEVSETQGMVRHDRHEARRLMDSFRQDGNLAKLYALEEQYMAALEEAKLRYGKPLVYTV
ncbi:hypothetical protein Q4I28_004476 [Leishmania naiffi]|uniref:Uncharacterized protein n=1 Tax=Leishmania naiffi TaxID=5678 RepID=A0AAW3BKG5_9TRYP